MVRSRIRSSWGSSSIASQYTPWYTSSKMLRIVFDGPADKLRGNNDVREFYLGLSEAGRRKSFREISSTSAASAGYFETARSIKS